MPDRFWVGGTATWDNVAGTKWAATSGGTGGASVPTSDDDVFFNAASGAAAVTVSNVVQGNCRNLTCTGFTGTLQGGSAVINVFGSVVISSGMTLGSTLAWSFRASSGSYTITSAGKTFGQITFGPVSSTATWSLSDALTSATSITVTFGTFTTNNFNVTATSLNSNNTNTRAINLGSSTLTFSASGPVTFTASTNLSFNAGTSQINCSSNNAAFSGGGLVFHNVSFTNTLNSTLFINQSNTFNNLSITGRGTVGRAEVSISSNQVINGTLTVSPGGTPAMRTLVRSNNVGFTRTLTCAAFSGGDADFRDITIAGAAAPVSGTRLGDCKGNSGIAFPAPKTVYWNLAAGGNWNAVAWALSPGAAAAVSINNFPLAQDTVVFQSLTTTLNSGATCTFISGFNVGTIDMSARTSNTMTLATTTTSPVIFGNWINGTGVTITGSQELIFMGRGSQTITSAGVPFTQALLIQTPGGSVTLQDAFQTSRSNALAIELVEGTFNANNYNVTLSAISGGVTSNTSVVRTLAIGSGTWTIAGTSPWTVTSANLTVTGTGTLNFTSTNAKTFAGGGVQTYPTINQGGTGSLTINGSNKFNSITNTALGSVLFQGGTTNEFTTFNLNGTSAAARLVLSSTNTQQATLHKPTAWNVGTGSVNSGNNTGLSFDVGGNDFLSISYINGTIPAVPWAVSSFLMFFG